MERDRTGQLRRWRHDLHRRAEAGFEEHATGDYLVEQLTALGLRPEPGVGGTGVVASLSSGTSRRAVALRADMDGLALTERTELPYASDTGRMHACGHDGHMTMLLGAAAVLAEEGGFDGTVRFWFQPAEEHGQGARAMIDDGLFARWPVDAVFGLHNLPGLPAGTLHTRPGPIMASEDTFEITVTGRGGHASTPHLVIDPIVVAAQIVTALQTVVSRNLDPLRSAVVSCTGIETDGVRNAIPSTVVVRGDTRSFAPDVQALLERRMRELCTGIAAAHGASATITYRHEFAPTVNDPGCAATAVEAAVAAIGAHRVDGDCAPMMGSEDFGLLARQVPGCFTFVGNGTAPDAGGTPLHSSTYDFNDDVAEVGVAFYTQLVRRVLGEDR